MVRIRGFTLIELLVVISIIALLIALLLPALGAATMRAKVVACTTQIHSFGQAGAAYAGDNDGYVVHPNWNKEYPGWLYDTLTASGNRIWPGQWPGGYEGRIKLRETSLLWEYLSRAGEVFHCPADEGPFNNNSVPVRAMTSYQYNGAACGYNTWRPQTYRIEEFRADAVFMWECDETRGGGFWNDGGNYPTEGLSRRHRDGAPFGRFDGSTIFYYQHEYYELAGQRHANALYCKPDSRNGR